MTKGKKTTQQERAEIVAFCLEHGRDYLLTVEHYGVSYQQIYAWVRKYEEKGIDGLVDGRGRTKPESEMTESEKLQAQVRMLEAQLREKKREIELLKKVKELVCRKKRRNYNTKRYQKCLRCMTPMEFHAAA